MKSEGISEFATYRPTDLVKLWTIYCLLSMFLDFFVDSKVTRQRTNPWKLLRTRASCRFIVCRFSDAIYASGQPVQGQSLLHRCKRYKKLHRWSARWLATSVGRYIFSVHLRQLIFDQQNAFSWGQFSHIRLISDSTDWQSLIANDSSTSIHPKTRLAGLRGR